MRQKKKINVDIPSSSGGLDTSNLPTKPWKKGTKVLAEQDGNPVFIQAAGDIFTDVTLRLTAQKTHTTIVTGNTDTVNLIATVTNAGTSPASDISVVLVKPRGTGYTLGEPQLQSQYASGFVATGDTTYTIATLQSGGVATITIPVTYDKGGTYSFGGQVTSTIDTNTANNSSTVVISVTETFTPTGGAYVPTQECPLFTIRDLEYDVMLKTTSTWDRGQGGTASEYADWVDTLVRSINIYADKRPLAGRRFQLSNVEQLVVQRMVTPLGNMRFSDIRWSSNIRRDNTHVSIAPMHPSPSPPSSSSSFSMSQDMVVAPHIEISQTAAVQGSNAYNAGILSTGYTFDRSSQILTFDESFTFDINGRDTDTNVPALVLYVKPRGERCRWQVCPIKFTTPLPQKNPVKTRFTHNSNLGDDVTFGYTHTPPNTLASSHKSWNTVTKFDTLAHWVGGDMPDDLDFFYDEFSDGINTPYINNVTVTVFIKSGTTGSFTLRSTDSYLQNVITVGKISTTYDRSTKTLTVNLDRPTPQNSVNLGAVQFVVVDNNGG